MSGQPFTWPATKAQASAEIRRLTAITRDTSRDQHIEAERHGPPPHAATVRGDEITGYGANCQWSRSTRGSNCRALIRSLAANACSPNRTHAAGRRAVASPAHSGAPAAGRRFPNTPVSSALRASGPVS
jgi:hypothetical protein